MDGFFAHFNELHSIVIIHAPEGGWEHKPREYRPSSGFWMGPISKEEEMVKAARDVAGFLDYKVQHCRVCFPDMYPPPPTHGDAPAGPKRRAQRQREYLPPQVSRKRTSRRGI